MYPYNVYSIVDVFKIKIYDLLYLSLELDLDSSYHEHIYFNLNLN